MYIPSSDSFWGRHPFLGALVCVNLWGFAILGPVFLVLGLLSFWFNTADRLYMFGGPVRTDAQKVFWCITNFGVSYIGIRFAVWHVRVLRHEKRSSST